MPKAINAERINSHGFRLVRCHRIAAEGAWMSWFAGTVQVLVVEFGNAHYQLGRDRFIVGEPIPARDLRPVWRDFRDFGTKCYE